MICFYFFSFLLLSVRFRFRWFVAFQDLNIESFFSFFFEIWFIWIFHFFALFSLRFNFVIVAMFQDSIHVKQNSFCQICFKFLVKDFDFICEKKVENKFCICCVKFRYIYVNVNWNWMKTCLCCSRNWQIKYWRIVLSKCANLFVLFTILISTTFRFMNTFVMLLSTLIASSTSSWQKQQFKSQIQKQEFCVSRCREWFKRWCWRQRQQQKRQQRQSLLSSLTDSLQWANDNDLRRERCFEQSLDCRYERYQCFEKNQAVKDDCVICVDWNCRRLREGDWEEKAKKTKKKTKTTKRKLSDVIDVTRHWYILARESIYRENFDKKMLWIESILYWEYFEKKIKWNHLNLYLI